MRPPGYEPGELPTAPLRDIINHCISFLKCECKGIYIYSNHQIFIVIYAVNIQYLTKMVIRQCLKT